MAELTNHECMQVFIHHAFRENEAKDPELLKVGESIVKKNLWCSFSSQDIGFSFV
jgi:hypothetical protein